jgi:uncharacterized protein
MRKKLTVATLFHAAALFALAAGCGGARTGPAGLAATNAAVQSPTAAQQTATPTPDAVRHLCEGLESPLPPPEGFVSDFANVLDEAAERRLEAKLGRLKARGNVELAVVTVETTGGKSPFDYSLAVACGWGVGPPETEEGGGLVLLLAVKDRKWHIQVSDRLLPDLPNETTAEIGGRMRPHLGAGDYGRGVETCVDGLVAHLAERRGFGLE